MAPVNSKQVGQLFNDAIAAIRNDTPDMDALLPQAIEWLTAARYKLLRDLERAYYELEHARDQPLLLPSWAIDPKQDFTLFTDDVPAVLQPYRSAMGDSLNNLLKDCGFRSTYGTLDTGKIWLEIYFPAQLAAGPAAPTAPRTLLVDDEFSTRAHTSAFGAGNFARLLTEFTDARNGSTANTQHRAQRNEAAEAHQRGESVPNATVPLAAQSTSVIADSIADELKVLRTLLLQKEEQILNNRRKDKFILGLECLLLALLLARAFLGIK